MQGAELICVVEGRYIRNMVITVLSGAHERRFAALVGSVTTVTTIIMGSTQTRAIHVVTTAHSRAIRM